MGTWELMEEDRGKKSCREKGNGCIFVIVVKWVAISATKIAQAYTEEFLETIRVKCFNKCITKPRSSLHRSESSCISRCVDRYIEAIGIVSKSLFSAQH
ncbi:hypothetical protein I3843_01G297400 [Carya illinoinensis]|nr:hypothetical protein I3760_01G303500 [Carya illinoinensis]KAG7999215.1 hypothetical protein I3843_01G297400 [Carya illinoinensis]